MRFPTRETFPAGSLALSSELLTKVVNTSIPFTKTFDCALKLPPKTTSLYGLVVSPTIGRFTCLPERRNRTLANEGGSWVVCRVKINSLPVGVTVKFWIVINAKASTVTCPCWIICPFESWFSKFTICPIAGRKLCNRRSVMFAEAVFGAEIVPFELCKATVLTVISYRSAVSIIAVSSQPKFPLIVPKASPLVAAWRCAVEQQFHSLWRAVRQQRGLHFSHLRK